MEKSASTFVLIWWGALGMIGLAGIGRWLYVAREFGRKQALLAPAERAARHWQLRLSGVYAFGCAFRAVFPRADVQRICLYDSWLSSVMLGRSIATVAELCFVIQWALMMREAAEGRGVWLATLTAKVVVPVIVVAEICSWYAVITTNFLGNTIEQSLWTLCVALLTLSLLMLAPRFGLPMRGMLRMWTGVGAVFVLFVSTVDVPMYATRWLADEEAHKTYFAFAAGLSDVATRWVVTYAFQDWKDEMAWMTMYFSVAVWLSISLVRTPWLGRVAVKANG